MDQLQTFVAGLTALVISVGALVAGFVKLWQRDRLTDERVDLLWHAHLRRGETEAKSKALVTEISKQYDHEDITMLVLKPEIRQAYAPIEPVLKQLRKSFPDTIPFIETVEKKFGSWLTKHICEPLGVNEYACLAIALAISEEEKLEI